MSNYGWIITNDLIDDGLAEGTMGPHDIPDGLVERLKKKDGAMFRLYDDDNELYYEGFVVVDDPDDEHLFTPLDDFGTPNAGCTMIAYKFMNKQWEII